MIEEARRSLANLVGERRQYVGRAAGLIWVGFGALRVVTGHNGRTREIAEYALHLQCPWRLLDGDEVVTGSYDVHQPRPGWSGDDDFDWDVQGANRFDARARKLTAYLAEESVVVTAADVTAWCDLTISFSDGLRLDALRTGSVRHEEWRFFRPYRDDEQVVVFQAPENA
ncbi:hypothetical protein [Lentzea nigeriaca]|uniref:hypothetical protein n=1 Tax=Lentzea nigeriaca TaxID=1128665 RepID=UPI0019591467|nr:hypothetical protein [Lentzea nigeriaca]MBM7859512.1 hypothetical protein [Lentzea nigeriaca]